MAQGEAVIDIVFGGDSESTLGASAELTKVRITIFDHFSVDAFADDRIPYSL